MVRRTKEEAEETRQCILDAAELLFYQSGVSRTSLADIATAAGVTRGAIYWHFENKVDLFQALLDRIHLPLEEFAQASESADEPDPLGQLRELLIRVLYRLEREPTSRRITEILLHKCEYIDAMGDLRQKMQSLLLGCDERIEKSLRNAVNRDQLPADLDCTRAARSLHAYIDGLQNNWLLAPDERSIAAEAELLVDSALDMLRLSPALRRHRTP